MKWVALLLACTLVCACERRGDGRGADSDPTVDPTGAGRDGRASTGGMPATSGPVRDAGPNEAVTDATVAVIDGGGPAEPPSFSHTLASVTIGPGEERTGVCQSWTLGNEEPLHVNRVVATNEGGLHHSNWIWVDEASYAGPDGTWPCAERGFEQILAAAVGGVFFAQSTQSQHDTQAFPEGVAFEMPARVRIIGDVHLLNPRATELETRVRFDLYTLPAEDVRVRLQPMAFTNTALDIAAGGDTSAHMQCAMPQPDFDIYYVLPHFHGTGRELRIDVAGGAMDGANVFTSDGNYGEPLGRTFDPPIAVRGALGLGITCEYTNPGASILRYGFGDQEMCVVLVYSTGKKAGGTAIANLSVMDVGGVHRTDALCLAVGTP